MIDGRTVYPINLMRIFRWQIVLTKVQIRELEKTILNLIWTYITFLINKHTEQTLHGLKLDRQPLNINSEYRVVEHENFQSEGMVSALDFSLQKMF